MSIPLLSTQLNLNSTSGAQNLITGNFIFTVFCIDPIIMTAPVAGISSALLTLGTLSGTTIFERDYSFIAAAGSLQASNWQFPSYPITIPDGLPMQRGDTLQLTASIFNNCSSIIFNVNAFGRSV